MHKAAQESSRLQQETHSTQKKDRKCLYVMYRQQILVVLLHLFTLSLTKTRRFAHQRRGGNRFDITVLHMIRYSPVRNALKGKFCWWKSLNSELRNRLAWKCRVSPKGNLLVKVDTQLSCICLCDFENNIRAMWDVVVALRCVACSCPAFISEYQNASKIFKPQEKKATNPVVCTGKYIFY